MAEDNIGEQNYGEPKERVMRVQTMVVFIAWISKQVPQHVYVWQQCKNNSKHYQKHIRMDMKKMRNEECDEYSCTNIEWHMQEYNSLPDLRLVAESTYIL